MEWLLILGLGAWVFFLTLQVGDLRQSISRLDRRILDLKEAMERLSQGERAAPKPPGHVTDLSPDSVHDERSHRVPRPEVVVAGLTEAAAPAPRVEAPAPRAERPRPPPRERPVASISPQRMRAWMEENLLAWAGGAALALGGLFLVVYAAQRGLFTPQLRIAAAVLLGVGLLGASEWLRRRGDYAQPAAVSAGAGATALYGAIWASYWLYDYVDLPVAGGLLAAISLGLVALSFRHGEPLALLAVLGGFLAPAITGPQHWTAPALTGFLALVTVTGYVVAGARRWGLAGFATLASAFLWAMAGFAAQGYDRVVALGVSPLALAYAAVEWRRRQGDTQAADPTATERRTPFDLLPAAAMLTAAIAVFALGFAGLSKGGSGNPVILPSAGLARRWSHCWPPTDRGDGCCTRCCTPSATPPRWAWWP